MVHLRGGGSFEGKWYPDIRGFGNCQLMLTAHSSPIRVVTNIRITNIRMFEHSFVRFIFKWAFLRIFGLSPNIRIYRRLAFGVCLRLFPYIVALDHGHAHTKKKKKSRYTVGKESFHMVTKHLLFFTYTKMYFHTKPRSLRTTSTTQPPLLGCSFTLTP